MLWLLFVDVIDDGAIVLIVLLLLMLLLSLSLSLSLLLLFVVVVVAAVVVAVAVAVAVAAVAAAVGADAARPALLPPHLSDVPEVLTRPLFAVKGKTKTDRPMDFCFG